MWIGGMMVPCSWPYNKDRGNKLPHLVPNVFVVFSISFAAVCPVLNTQAFADRTGTLCTPELAVHAVKQ